MSAFEWTWKLAAEKQRKSEWAQRTCARIVAFAVIKYAVAIQQPKPTAKSRYLTCYVKSRESQHAAMVSRSQILPPQPHPSNNTFTSCTKPSLLTDFLTQSHANATTLRVPCSTSFRPNNARAGVVFARTTTSEHPVLRIAAQRLEDDVSSLSLRLSRHGSSFVHYALPWHQRGWEPWLLMSSTLSDGTCGLGLEHFFAREQGR